MQQLASHMLLTPARLYCHRMSLQVLKYKIADLWSNFSHLHHEVETEIIATSDFWERIGAPWFLEAEPLAWDMR